VIRVVVCLGLLTTCCEQTGCDDTCHHNHETPKLTRTIHGSFPGTQV
jgi:hypothetical protein